MNIQAERAYYDYYEHYDLSDLGGYWECDEHGRREWVDTTPLKSMKQDWCKNGF